MQSFKSIGILRLSPILHCSACRYAPIFLKQALRAQCLSIGPGTVSRTYLEGNLSRQSSTLRTIGSSGFTCRVAAAFSSKITRFNPKTDLYSFESAKAKGDIVTGKPRSGQDAFFVSKIGQGNSIAFGVADGVGGWIESGIDSAHFSHALCKYMAKAAREMGDMGEKLRASELLQLSYDSVVADDLIGGGGSTACVAIVRPNGKLEVANLGDSGFVQFRLNAIHHYSNPQTHAFNTPYQLSIIPPKILARARLFGGEPLNDYPRDASVAQHEVHHGDILVFATDGVWDNLRPLDLLKIVGQQMKGNQAWVDGEKGLEVSDILYNLTQKDGIQSPYENTLQTLLAANIVGEAKAASQDSNRDGPFAQEIQKHFPHEKYRGGKADDICVVVAVVVNHFRH